jgi:type I restriction enzyme S subunit
MTIKDKYQEFIDIWFVYYWVQTIKEEMISKAGKTTFPFLSVTKLGDFLIPLPPIEEQKRIVEKLEILLAEIDKLEQDEKALKELEDKFPERLKSAIMLSAIQGNLSQRITTKEESSILKKKILDKKEELIKNNIIRKEKQYPKEENEVFIIPDEWEIVELADIVHFTKTIKKKTEDKLPYLDVKSLRTNEYSNFRTNGEIVEVGDYAILVDGQNSGEIFKISKRGSLGSTLRKILINPIIEHDYALLILDFYKNTFRDNKRGAAIPHLDFKIFNTSVVPLPSILEQKRIVEKLDELFRIDLLNM